MNYITAGSLALMMHYTDSEFGKHSYNQYVLDKRVSIYGLQPVGGVPQEITDAQFTCMGDDGLLNLPAAD